MSLRTIPELMLTIDEVAAALKCSRTKVKELLRDDAIRSVKIGGLRRVRFTDLEAYVGSLAPAEINRSA